MLSLWVSFILPCFSISFGFAMEFLVSIDRRGRLLIPVDVRRRLGIRDGSRVLLRVRDDGVLEVVPFDKLLREVSEVFDSKFRDWREEDHEAGKKLEDMVR